MGFFSQYNYVGAQHLPMPHLANFVTMLIRNAQYNLGVQRFTQPQFRVLT